MIKSACANPTSIQWQHYKNYIRNYFGSSTYYYALSKIEIERLILVTELERVSY